MSTLACATAKATQWLQCVQLCMPLLCSMNHSLGVVNALYRHLLLACHVADYEEGFDALAIRRHLVYHSAALQI